MTEHQVQDWRISGVVGKDGELEMFSRRSSQRSLTVTDMFYYLN
jgi:hypothetical protein